MTEARKSRIWGAWKGRVDGGGGQRGQEANGDREANGDILRFVGGLSEIGRPLSGLLPHSVPAHVPLVCRISSFAAVWAALLTTSIEPVSVAWA